MKKSLLFLFIPLFVVTGCSTEGAMQKLLGQNVKALILYGYKTGADGGISFTFSEPVGVTSAYFDPPLEVESCTEGETVTFYFKTGLKGGSKVTADILVEDKNRNTLNVLVPFRTRNNSMPEFVINEIRADYGKPKVEFIELKISKAGNLGALRLFAAYDKADAIFEFPPADVKAGEYVVLHTRSIEEGLKDETGTNLNESKGTDSSSARDFWMPGSLKIHSTNALYAMDQDDRIIDGLVLVNSAYKWKDTVAEAAALMASQGAWSGSGPEDAFNSDGCTVTRTICRTAKDTNSAADWYITVTSGATPGKANNPGRYK